MTIPHLCATHHHDRPENPDMISFQPISLISAKWLLAIIFFVSVLSSASYSQWGGSFSLLNGFDDNAFGNYNARSAMFSGASVMFGYFPEEENWDASYSGSLYTFAQFPDRQYSLHSFALSYTLPYGEDENSVSIFTSGAGRIGRESMAIYDYLQALGSVTLKHTLTQSFIARTGYRAKYRTYPDFYDLTYLEHFGFIGSNIYLETKTSILTEINLGYKNYLATPGSEQSLSQGNIASQSGSLLVAGNGPGGNGGGGGQNGSAGNGKGNMRMIGLNQGGKYGGMEAGVHYLVYEEPSTSQLSALINLGQSIAEGTGVSVRYQQRWNLLDRGRAFVGGALDFLGDEELFDDRYSYESKEITVTITQLLPWALKLQLGSFWFDKRYPYPSTLDYSTETGNRHDYRMGGWINLEKSFDGSWLLFDGLVLSAGYLLTRNQSNSVYYDFSSNAFSFEISTQF